MAKTGLIMEGGAMRGVFTAGVTDVFQENNIEFDGTIGVSAGAGFGCNVKSKQNGRVIRYLTEYCKNELCGFKYLFKSGDYFNRDLLYEKIPFELDVFDGKTFHDNPREFYVVCTDIETGEPVYHKCETGDRLDMTWFRASAALPMFAEPVGIDGKKYVDGGVSDSIPLRFFESIGYEKNIIIHTKPKNFIMKKSKIQIPLKILYKDYPAVIGNMEKRHIDYNNETRYIKSQEECGKVYNIYPKDGFKMKMTEKNPHKLQEIYDMGRQTALEQLDEIIKFMG